MDTSPAGLERIPLIQFAMLLYLSVGSALALLLLQNDLALPFHRLAGIYVLYDIRRKEQAESPFYLFLARFLEPFGGLLPANSSTPAQMVELKFIHLLLSNGDPDVSILHFTQNKQLTHTHTDFLTHRLTKSHPACSAKRLPQCPPRSGRPKLRT